MKFEDRDKPTLTAELVEARVPRWVVSDSSVPARAELVFVHGLCEHAFRFFRFARSLAVRGIRVHLFHQLGHGVHGEEASRFDWLARSYFEERRPEDVLDDVSDHDPAEAEPARRHAFDVMRTLDHWQNVERAESVFEAVRARAEAPIFLGGHSLGGLVAVLAGARLGRRDDREVSGVALFSPALRPRGSAPGGWLEQFLVGLSWRSARTPLLRPLHPLLSAVTKLGLRIDVQWASQAISDRSNQSQLHALDPLVLDQAPLSFLGRTERLMVAAQREARCYPVPIWMVAGQLDRVVDTRGVEEFRAQFDAPAAEQSSISVLEGFAPHDPLRSSRAEECTEELIEWITTCPSRFPPRSR